MMHEIELQRAGPRWVTLNRRDATCRARVLPLRHLKAEHSRAVAPIQGGRLSRAEHPAPAIPPITRTRVRWGEKLNDGPAPPESQPGSEDTASVGRAAQLE